MPAQAIRRQGSTSSSALFRLLQHRQARQKPSHAPFLAPNIRRYGRTRRPRPTDHRELFLFTSRSLVGIRRATPRAHIIVNLSPGTPAMQTVMLLALQARLAGDDVQAFHGTPPDKRRRPRDVVREVPWNLLAELAATPTEIDDVGTRPAAWSLEHARSSKLRDVATLVNQYVCRALCGPPLISVTSFAASSAAPPP